jgi:uncharacterized membrane protein YbhN (UPF0104 family)
MQLIEPQVFTENRSRLHAFLPIVILVTTMGLLLLAIGPTDIVHALAGFNAALFPAIIVLASTYFGIQAVRWYFLLRTVGVPMGMLDTQLVSLAGQVAALLPLGQYARALLASKTTGARLGTIASTLVVQEWTYTLVLLTIAVPGSFSHPGVIGTLLTSLSTTTLIALMLVVPAAYRMGRYVLAAVPIARRGVPSLDDLHDGTMNLLSRPSTLLGTAFTVTYSLLYVTLLWTVAQGVHAGSLSWQGAAFVCAVSRFAGFMTTLPGGLGAYEASMVALLVAMGMHPALAVATTILFTVTDRGLGTFMGLVPYLLFQRKFGYR